MEGPGSPFERALGRLAVPLRRIGGPVFCHETVASTNDLAAAHAAAGSPEGIVVVAAEQTAGRGRHGRTWVSPSGAGLYVSVLLRPPGEVAGLLTLTGGVALAEGVRDATGLEVEIKWPNDLLVPGTGRKLAGILVEATAAGGRLQHAIFGFGVNLRAAVYPPEVRARATSLEEELGRAVDSAEVFASALAALDRRYHELLDGGAARILARWRELAPRSHGARIQWHDQGTLRTGRTAGLAEDGALLVQTAAGLERIVAGEVNWK